MLVYEEEQEAEVSTARIGNRAFLILAVTVVLVNAYAGGCATYGFGPLEVFSTFSAAPLFVLEFLLGGLAFYLGAITVVGLVFVFYRLLSKRWLAGEAFLIWSTAVNFSVVALAGGNGA